MTSSTTTVVLEPAAQEFAAATADPPYLFDLGPVEGRKTVDKVQSEEIEKPDVDDRQTRASPEARRTRCRSGSSGPRAQRARCP